MSTNPFGTFGEFLRAVTAAETGPPDPRLVEIPARCERCGDPDDALERHTGLRDEGKWLCHDCEGDARMEE